MSEPFPLAPYNRAGVHPDDGPQDIPQTPGSVVVSEVRDLDEGILPSTVDDLLNIARAELGTTEHSDGWTKYGEAYERRRSAHGFARAAWCDMFLGWCASQANALNVVGDYAYTPSHADWFHNRGPWGQTPKRGAIVFFDWAGSHSIPAIDHVGIVEAIRTDGSVVTIEGNTDNAVRRRIRRTGIAGYGYPTYTAGGGKPPHPPAKPGSTPPRWPGRNLTQPPIMRGTDVRTWQTQMRRRGWHIAIDAAYGPGSEQICRDFQHEKGLRADGIVGPITWHATWATPIT